MKTKQWIIGLLVLLFAVSGCQKSKDDKNEAKVPVEVSEAVLGEVTQTLHYNGDIKAALDVKVFSKIPDRIERYYVDEGDEVKASEPIARVMATTIEQAVRQAEAGLAAAQAQMVNMDSEYARAKRLFKEEAMSKQQFDAVRTQYEAVAAQLKQAKAALAAARSQLRDATITAPIAGIIGKRFYETGDMAAPSLPVATVVRMDSVKITFEATESDLGMLKVGQNAIARVRSYPDEKFTGYVTKISPILDPITRMATVEVVIPNPDRRLKPGMFAEIDITVGSIRDVIVIPRYAVIENTSLVSNDGSNKVVKNYFVFVVNDSLRAEQRKLDVRYVNHRSIAVNSGVEVGEKFVIAGQNNLRDGVPVLLSAKEEAN